jgi:hypothetical protein
MQFAFIDPRDPLTFSGVASRMLENMERITRLCHGNSIKHAWRAEARDASCHSNGILPLCSGFGSEDPKGGSRDEVALKVKGVVNRTMHVEEALGGSS